METLHLHEAALVGGGMIQSPESNIKCTVGTSGANCTGSLADIGGVIADGYNWAVGATTDAIEWVSDHI